MQRFVSQTFFSKSVALLSLVTIAACDLEAGSEVDEGAFGNPTMNNVLIQSGERSYAVDLARRFAEETPSTINFAFNSSTLDANARAALQAQARWIKQFPEMTFRVYGHTDLVGSQSYNKSLGLRRAQAAVNYLVSQGISRSRLDAVVSYGKTQPIIATSGPERRNRRTVTEVNGFVQNHPTVMNGKYAQVVFRDYVASAVPATELTGFDSSVTE
ncbi:OmpA family protein [Falsihalocynthiibacter sp. SS001]|uniref:OmpA family protein n=1 Tax=Falsihalocynthiibacter sp. SS001 TaxID=3349698 RepID=UPI0036D25182